MQEEFLHYIWKYKKFRLNNLKTTQNELVDIQSVGHHNQDSGPDFFNAKIVIGEQLWAGNVEVHVKSSDWFLHNHETDASYDNVILHVVWEDDSEIYRSDNSVIPALELKQLIERDIIVNYEKLYSNHNKWINCEASFDQVDDFVIDNWLERLYFERLEQKSETINQLLKESRNDWEAVLFKMLAKNFGLKVNGEAFLSLAKSVDFSVIRKTQSNLTSLEALLFGQAGLLESDLETSYFKTLQSEYKFLGQKFGLNNNHVLPVKFFRLRPLNFPTIRLSQLACLYHEHQNLFSKIIETNNRDGFYKLFRVSTSDFWKNHYTFQKESKASAKTLTKSFIDLLLINTMLPIKFCYSKQLGHDSQDEVLKIASKIASEKNSIITSFNNLKQVSRSAMDSQALIQLKSAYCDKNRCIQCAIGSTILSQ
ncbi:DUF2851 family protein [Seonamhaeicola sp. ML3]|uniref:DUF2851 family protein n=1 Tax=Seonamhaeicola sp. ML3 TaxID=2937786 RepID=UPI00200CBE51|nr:DUF2851 family protein [Seonamhaeicola sp. ML3]